LGQVVFMAGAAFVVARTSGATAVAAEADTRAGAALIIAVPTLLMVAVHWQSLERPKRWLGESQNSSTQHDNRSHIAHTAGAESKLLPTGVTTQNS
jgi:hypothetical protein